MKAIIIYDSVFGNTEKVALAINKAFTGDKGSGTFRVGHIQPDQLKDVDLLIIGSPTRKFQATPASKEFIKNIPRGSLKGVKVAAFDTRISTDDIQSGFLKWMMNFFGYAAGPLARRLQRKGGQLIADPEGFIVQGTEGHMKDGERERAEPSGKTLKGEGNV